MVVFATDQSYNIGQQSPSRLSMSPSALPQISKSSLEILKVFRPLVSRALGSGLKLMREQGHSDRDHQRLDNKDCFVPDADLKSPLKPCLKHAPENATKGRGASYGTLVIASPQYKTSPLI